MEFSKDSPRNLGILDRCLWICLGILHGSCLGFHGISPRRIRISWDFHQEQLTHKIGIE